MIPLFKVHSPHGVEAAVRKVFESGFITEGEFSDRFELELSEWMGNKNCALVNSCTSALTLAYDLCGIGPGTEVITTPMTCMATNEPLHLMGAKLVWADIDPSTGNIDPEDVRKKITSKTRAIVGVHWSGLPFDIAAISAISSEYGIPVVEDAAHALGAKYHGKKIGNHSDFVCFSFQAIKHITTADGGAVFCKEKSEVDQVRRLRWFGLDRKHEGSRWAQDITRAGYKFHMNNLNATIGLLQMQHIDRIVASHQSNGLYYEQHIENPKVTKLRQSQESESAYWIYTVLVDDRDAFADHLNSRGVACDVVHVRNDTYSVFDSYRGSELSGVTEFGSRMINIPVGWWLSSEDRRHIVRLVNSY
jgi:dTDP-4-amino-4,6-dideoxygalactose transaminase